MGPDTNVSEFKIRYDMTRPTTAVEQRSRRRSGATQRIPSTFPVPGPAMPPPLGGLYPFGIPWGSTIPSLARSDRNPADHLAGRNRCVHGAGTEHGDAGNRQPILMGRHGGRHGRCRRSACCVRAEHVNVRGVGLFFSGSYYVTRVSHTIDCNSYIQKFEARRNAVTMTGRELFVQP